MQDDLNKRDDEELRDDPQVTEDQAPSFEEQPEQHEDLGGQDLYEAPGEPEDDVNDDNDFYEEPSYRQSDDSQIPRWQPYYEEPAPKRQPEKKKKGWMIPLIVVLAIMVAAIVTGVVIGAQRINEVVGDSNNIAQDEAFAAPETKPETPAVDTAKPDVAAAQGGAYVLTDVSAIVEETMPAVVSITSRTLIDNGGFGSYWDFFFGGSGNSQGSYDGPQEVDSGLGSGTIIEVTDEELLILTSYHVVKDCSSLYVTFHDGNSVDGKIKSQSESEDIAIVSVPLSDISEETKGAIKVAALSAEPVKVGEGVIVIGNALGYGMSVTTGVISATDRQLNLEGTDITVLQTDAAINSGNSGGCVLNSAGEIIGISEAKITRSYVEGMCYAIPISIYSGLIKELLETEGAYVDPDDTPQGGQSAYLGIRGRDIDRSVASSYGMPQGIYVASTIPGSGAEAAGLEEGDIIVGLDNVSFTTMSELQEQLARHEAGDTVEIIIMRDVDGKYTQMKMEVTLTDQIG